jgi:hypothetical protein
MPNIVPFVERLHKGKEFDIPSIHRCILFCDQSYQKPLGSPIGTSIDQKEDNFASCVAVACVCAQKASNSGLPNYMSDCTAASPAISGVPALNGG